MPGLRERRRFSAVFVIALVIVVLTGFCFFKSSRAEVLLPNESGPELFHDTIRVGSFSVYLVNNVYLGERTNFWGVWGDPPRSVLTRIAIRGSQEQKFIAIPDYWVHDLGNIVFPNNSISISDLGNGLTLSFTGGDGIHSYEVVFFLEFEGEGQLKILRRSVQYFGP